VSFRWGIPELDHGNVWIPEPVYRFHGPLGVKGNYFVLIVHLAAFKYESRRGKAMPSLSTIAERMGLSRRRIIELVQKLESDGWLKVKRQPTVHGDPDNNEYNFEPFAKACWALYTEGGEESRTTPGEESRTTVVKDSALPTKEEEHKNKKSKNKTAVSRRAQTLLDYLNNRTSRSGAARFTSWAGLRERLDEGATEDDVRVVVDLKIAQWTHVEKMRAYIRPRTLFGRESFAGYLSEARDWDQRGRPSFNSGHNSQKAKGRSAADYEHLVTREGA